MLKRFIKPRPSVVETKESVVITTPSVGGWVGVLMLPLAVFCETMLFWGIFRNPALTHPTGTEEQIVKISAIVMAFWLGPYALNFLLWKAFGHKVVEIRADGICIRKVTPVNPSRFCIQASQVLLRIEPEPPITGWEQGKELLEITWGFQRGPFHFYSFRGNGRFGGSMAQKDAEALLERIKARFPAYAEHRDLPSGLQQHSDLPSGLQQHSTYITPKP